MALVTSPSAFSPLPYRVHVDGSLIAAFADMCAASAHFHQVLSFEERLTAMITFQHDTIEAR